MWTVDPPFTPAATHQLIKKHPLTHRAPSPTTPRRASITCASPLLRLLATLLLPHPPPTTHSIPHVHPPSSPPPQYPSEIPGYESEGGFFAENMLPEGAHNHEEDWTVFFLNRDVENTVGGPVDVTA